MTDFLDRISKLSPKRLALLALEQHEQIEAAERRAREPIAIVGMSCRFPGGANSPAAYWELLAGGRDAICEVPRDRWDIDAYFDPDPDAPARMSTRSGGFLADISSFDSGFFGVAPREALSMDPQHRMLLQVTWEAFEDAGIVVDALAGSATGVFVGICSSDYFTRLLGRGHEAIDAYLASGSALSVAAGRIAYSFGFQGPALSIDTSCSASLVALHVACRSLRSGETKIAVAGGVNAMCSPETTIALSKSHMLAPDGRCKAFDASADGFARGEGCGVLILKRLSDARADGDRILAVIRGSAVNQDGRSGGLTVPNGPAQEAVIRAALADAAVQPGDIDYVEAHGTGTSLGDPIEVRALANALGAGRTAANPLLVGSVKTNLGHLESAAGIAGVMKVVLALRHGRIPPHLHFNTPSPHIPWADFPVKVTSAETAWPNSGRPRRAGVSSFGFSGTNAHAILEEAPADDLAEPDAVEFGAARALQCIPVSARSRSAVLALASRYADALEKTADWVSFAHTAGAGRSHLAERATIVAGDRAAAVAAMRALQADTPHPAVQRGSVSPGQSAEIVFLYTGQGSQYPGMARQVYEGSAVFRQVIDRCDALLGADARGHTLKTVLWELDGEQPPIHETAWTQPALFAVEYGLTQVWRSWGIEPAAVIGHSVGEYVAACVAGVFTLEDGIRLIAERGRLMQALPGKGAMAALFAPESEVAAAVAPRADRVAIAAINAADSIVISGAPAAVEEILEHFARRNVRSHRLFISLAAHSPLVAPALDEMEACAARVQMHPPRIPVAWNLTGGKALPAGGAPDARYWRRHLREPVRFAAGIAQLHADGFRNFLEVGPHPTLIALAQQSLPEDSVCLTASLRRGKDDWPEMLASVANLYVHGASLDWSAVAGPGAGRHCDVPTYPFEARKFWPEVVAPVSAARAPGVTPTPNLFYRLSWEEAAAVRPASPHLRAPRSFEGEVRESFSRLAAAHGLAIYDELLPELDRLSADHIILALTQLDFDAHVGRVFEVQAEIVRLGVLPRHARLFARMLDILVEDGFLRHQMQGAAAEVVRALPRPDPAQRYDALLQRFGAVDGELRTLRRCATSLAEVLRGTQDPLQLLFPDGSLTEARQLYVESPYARSYNAALAQALQAAIAQLPPDARLRILEIGAGTGGTTGYVLPLLPADRVDYTFTDLSPLFLERAAEQFAAYPFLRYALLNIEQDPGQQGFEHGGYDIVIAANVLHATADLTNTVSHARGLLHSGGLLLLLEAVAPERWADLTFGLTDGWWRFTDTQLRPAYALLSREKWRDLLSRSGYDDVAVIPDAGMARGATQQALIMARAPAQRRPWVLVGAADGLGAVLARSLRARGAVVIQRAADATDVSLSGACEWVYLGALDLAERSAEDASAVSACETLACQEPLRWLGAAVNQDVPLRAWLVTRGAQSVAGPMLPGARWQAPLWGVGRVFALEQPGRWGGLVDLAPEDSLEAQADAVLSVIDAGGVEDQVALRDGKRFVARLLPSEPPAAAPMKFRSDATYLIVGGFGGLGLILARWMASNGARHLALLGRKPDPSAPGLREVEALGASVIALAGDVADEEVMRAHLARLALEAPPLRGIFHAAVAFSPAPVGELTDARIREALRPKIQGTAVLQHLTRSLELDFLVFFSSTAALTGALGMAHYAAANVFQDTTAVAFNTDDRRVLSVNWGAWDTIRLASDEVRLGYQKGGLESMRSADALDALGRLLSSRDPRGVVANIDWSLFKPVYEARRVRPLLAHLGREQIEAVAPAPRAAASAASVKASATALPALLERLAQAPAVQRDELLIGFVRDEVAAVLGVPQSDQIALETGLFDLGMDSLMTVELRRRLERGVARKLPSTLTFNYPNVGALAGFLARELGPATPSVAPPAAEPQSASRDIDSAKLDEPNLDELSEAELEERLLARLSQTR
jgi:microcystin synthetase protein McyG